MGLINHVLSDLERRGAVKPGTAVKTVSNGSLGRSRILIASLLAVPLVIALLQVAGYESFPARQPQMSPQQDMISAAHAQETFAVAGTSQLQAADTLMLIPDTDLPARSGSGNHSDAGKPARQNASRAVKPAGTQAVVAKNSGDAKKTPVARTPAKHDAETLYRQAINQYKSGGYGQALLVLDQALQLEPFHQKARQLQVSILVGQGQRNKAERILEQVIAAHPGHGGSIALLARLRAERGALREALSALRAGLLHTRQNAEYHGLYAGLLQRNREHEEAVAQFAHALQSSPRVGVWQMGMGISLQSIGKKDDARVAYQKSLAAPDMTAELREFVQRRLVEL